MCIHVYTWNLFTEHHLSSSIVNIALVTLNTILGHVHLICGSCRVFSAVRLLFRQEFQHLIVQADVVALHVAIGLISLKVDAESRKLLETLCMPAFLLHTLLNRLCDVFHECKLVRVDWVLCCLVPAKFITRVENMLLEEGKTGSLVVGILIAAESLSFHYFSRTVLFLD